MTKPAVTIDFHDTLVHCGSWFQLEIQGLPSAFLQWRACADGSRMDSATGASLDRAYRRLRTAIIQHGHELSAQRCLTVLFEQSGLSVDDATIELGVRELMAATLPDSSLVNGAFELVRALSEADVPLAIVSSAVYHPFLEWALERHGLKDRFGAITTSASCGYYKSRPEIYWLTLDRLGSSSAGSVHLGDSARFDVLGARRAGMRTVWLNPNGVDPHEAAPDYTVASLHDALEPVLSLLGR